MIDYSRFDSAIGLNWYDADPNLQQILRRKLDPEDLQWCEHELHKIGALTGGPIAERAEISDRNPPQLVKFDKWGEEVNQIVHHPGALATKADAWTSGISGPRLRNEAARLGRAFPQIVQSAANYMLSQAETGMLCAIGMTSGVRLLVERYAPHGLREEMLARLTAESFDEAWDGAMFLTERTGGSDLGTLTTGARQEGDRWLLNGSKWFCSNADAALIAALARPEGAQEGVKGIALFVVPKLRSDGRRNGISIRRLKDKLGTRVVPTAEADFVDAEAYLLAADADSNDPARDGRGINRMMEMVNESRHGVSVMALGIMRRCLLESAIFASHRMAFGRRLWDLPMMREMLVAMIVELEAAAALVFESAGEGPIARLLTPVAKLRATRRGVELASQAVEVHGGNGYIETWPVARQLRDAQCHTIWEGSENIICLDIIRAFRDERVMRAVFERFEAALAATDSAAADVRDSVAKSMGELREALLFLSRAERNVAELRARAFGNYLADAAQAALLLEEASWELRTSGNARKALIAKLFVRAHLNSARARAIVSNDRAVLDFFEPILGYGAIDRAAVASLSC